MKKTRMKILAVAMALVMVAVSSSLLTMAYLTSSTGPVTNVFTNSAKIKITLDEAKVDTYGVPITSPSATRVNGNTYKLIPGHIYVKDPTIHVEQGSEACYLFVEVVNPLVSIEAAGEKDKTIAKQMSEFGWTQISTGSNIHYFESVIDAREADARCTVFSHLKLKTDADVSKSYGNITIKAYAVQADGFTSATEAWSATFGAVEETE